MPAAPRVVTPKAVTKGASNVSNRGGNDNEGIGIEDEYGQIYGSRTNVINKVSRRVRA